jgi:hypothetical protein
MFKLANFETGVRPRFENSGSHAPILANPAGPRYGPDGVEGRWPE